MMDNHRKEYIQECKEALLKIQAEHKLLMHYIRDKKNNRIGVLVAIRPEGHKDALIGWALCNVKRDHFNKYIGILKAISRIQNGNPLIEDDIPYLPKNIEKELPFFQNRIARYFKEKE